jgi:hypothetical protein
VPVLVLVPATGNGLYFFVVLQLPRPVLVATDGTVVSSLGRVCGKGTLDLALFYLWAFCNF